MHATMCIIKMVCMCIVCCEERLHNTHTHTHTTIHMTITTTRRKRVCLMCWGKTRKEMNLIAPPHLLIYTTALYFPKAQSRVGKWASSRKLMFLTELVNQYYNLQDLGLRSPHSSTHLKHVSQYTTQPHAHTHTHIRPHRSLDGHTNRNQREKQKRKNIIHTKKHHTQHNTCIVDT